MRIPGVPGDKTRIGELVKGLGSARAQGQALGPGLIPKKLFSRAEEVGNVFKKLYVRDMRGGCKLV